MITRNVVESCCGKVSYIFHASKQIKKKHVQIFEAAGFSAALNLQQQGIFYIRAKNMIATSPFGTNRISVRCWGDDCERILDDFEELLEKAVNTKVK